MKIGDFILARKNDKIVSGSIESIDGDKVTLVDHSTIHKSEILGKVVDLSQMKGFITRLRESEQVFTCEFVKRTTGEYRVMNCRFGVTKHLVGGKKAWDDKDQGLATVFDMKKGAYRSIALENVVVLKFDGKVYISEQNQHHVK